MPVQPDAARSVNGAGRQAPVKNEYIAARVPVLTVAAPSRLHERIYPSHRAVDDGEVHVHARFDELGGKDPAVGPCAQPSTDLINDRFAVDGAHQCREVKRVAAANGVIERPRMGTGIDDAKHL